MECSGAWNPALAARITGGRGRCLSACCKLLSHATLPVGGLQGAAQTIVRLSPSGFSC